MNTKSTFHLNYWDTRQNTEKHQNKGVHWQEKGFILSAYSCLHFIQLSLFDLSSMKRFCIGAIIHIVDTACHCQEKNSDYVCLGSTPNRISVLLEILSKYFATLSPEAYLELSQTSTMGHFAKMGSSLSMLTIFAQKLHL